MGIEATNTWIILIGQKEHILCPQEAKTAKMWCVVKFQFTSYN